MKRKMFFRLTAVCLMAVSVLIACTKDYGSDIKKLQDDMDKLSAQVSKLQECIDNGCVITDVTPIDNGVKVTLSNGKDPFYIYNGKDGKDGEDGEDGKDGKDGKDGTVWKIGDNGNWWSSTEGQPFVDTGMASRGPKGDTGKSAYEVAKDNGFNGTEAQWIASLKGDKGDKGDTGDYYYPCTEKESENYGKWIKVDGATGTPTVTDQYWLPEGTLTAVWNDDEQTLEIHNVEGADDGIVTISLATSLNSLAVIPEIWDANLGMPQATVYAITPSAWEVYQLLRGSDGQYTQMPTYLNSNGGFLSDKEVYAGNAAWFNARFWCMLYNSYLSAVGKASADYGYDAQWDVNSPSFAYKWPDATAYGDDAHAIEEGEVAWSYATIANSVKSAIEVLGARLSNASNAPASYFWRQPPVSALNLKYRVNPAGANMDEYLFTMIDRTLQVGDILETKADGDHRNNAVVKTAVKQKGSDQLDVTAYVDYFKYWADKPIEFLIKMMSMKTALAWDYQATAIFQNLGSFANTLPPAYANLQFGELPSTYLNTVNITASTYSAMYNSMKNWVDANSISYETIVALEAAKNANGAEAIVSDYTSVKLRYLYPLWTAFNRHFEEGNQAARWRLAYNANTFATYGQVWALENDYLVEGQTYDVAAHMRFADPYYGRLEDLGFEVIYNYYTYDTSHSEPAHSWTKYGYMNDGTYDDDICGETIDRDFDGYDKVNVTKDGKVSVKEDAEDYIGRYVMICADATIKDNATGKLYGSVYGPTYNPDGAANATQIVWLNTSRFMFLDEFIGHYLLLIVPDSNKTKNVTFDLGDIDYLALSQTFKTPAPLESLDPRPQEGRDHKWDDALEMDMTGFNNIYTSDPVLTATPAVPESYSATFSRAAEMFAVTLNNKTPLGEGHVTYTFTPKDNKYSTVCYTIKWNVVINWAETEPILHEDYILYDDNPTNTKLTKTIINPDPATLDAWKNYRTVSTDLTKVPYVDSIVSVKGKKVGEGWKPQSSIKEHIHDYGQYLVLQPNIADLSMSIDWANTKNSAGQQLATTSAEIITPDGAMAPTYKLQEILMKENFKAYEQYRDYLINITVKLANGSSKIVKAYIVRFINPFKLKVTDVELHTHREDWCAKRANIQLLDAQSDAVVYDFQTNVIDASYRDLYPGILEAIQDPANMPTWKIAEPLDPSFGEPGEFLRVDPTTGWFYWRNAGTNLQNDKTTTYEVRMNLPALAELADTGEITVLNVDHSYVFHKECDPNDPTPEPNENGRPIWEVVFE